MLKKIRTSWQPYMLRPLIHMAFTRLVLALFIALLADFFLSPAAGRDLRGSAFLLAGLLFAVLGWVAWLRLDGIRLPHWMMLRLNPRKKPARMFGGDIIDHIDDKPMIAFEDLDDEEKDVCLLLADACCCAVFLAASLLF